MARVARWTSFEAESLPIAAYRYDSRLPSNISKAGFFPSPQFAGEGPSLKYFDSVTVFAAGSREGADHFLLKDVNIFNTDRFRYDKPIESFNKYKEEFGDGVNKEDFFKKLRLPHLYRLKINTHNSIAFKQLTINFGVNFEKLIYERFKEQLLNNPYINPFKIRNLLTGYPNFKKNTNDLIGGAIKNGLYPNDEVHIKGPIINESLLSYPRIDYYSAAYLDLATK